jgi:hypothetical protein
MQNRSVVVHYQHRFAAHLDEAVDGEVGKRLIASTRRRSSRFRISFLNSTALSRRVLPHRQRLAINACSQRQPQKFPTTNLMHRKRLTMLSTPRPAGIIQRAMK